MSSSKAGVKIKMQSTSLQALKGMSKKKLGYYQRLVFNELMKHGDEGQTAKEIELTLKYNYTDSRVNELVAMGWIVRTDRKKINPTGASATILIVPKHIRKGGAPSPVEASKQKQQDISLLLRAEYRRACGDVIKLIAKLAVEQSNIRVPNSPNSGTIGMVYVKLAKEVSKLVMPFPPKLGLGIK